MKDARPGAKPKAKRDDVRRPGKPPFRPSSDRKAEPRLASRAPGEAARSAAVYALAGVFHFKRAFDDVLPEAAAKFAVETRDRAFARAIAAAALRHKGSLQHVITRFLDKPLPKDTGRLDAILLAAVAQLLILKTPPHAAISIAVDQCRLDSKARRFDKLVNAVLRRVSEKGAAILASVDTVSLDIPPWMLKRWRATYGEQAAGDIARASLAEAPLDLSVKGDAAGWARKLGGTVLPSGSVRLKAGGRIEDLEGYGDGAWWVQDAAAAMPAKLLGDVRGLEVGDICAAPGGKTAQLAAAGARVVAVDASAERLARLTTNLARLGLAAETVAADVTTWNPPRKFDAILVDAPCTATGTIRRHPDILHLKRPEDVGALAAIQAGVLSAASRLLKQTGRMIYCTCSLEPEEGPMQIDAFLKSHPEFEAFGLDAALIGGMPGIISADGTLRTLPSQLQDAGEGLSGLDGFYAAGLRRKARPT